MIVVVGIEILKTTIQLLVNPKKIQKKGIQMWRFFFSIMFGGS
jgi:divalent metal cation (Fe/Co/Zn/Cd) transporter